MSERLEGPHRFTVDPDTGTVFGTHWGHPVGVVGNNGYIKLTAWDGDRKFSVLGHRVVWEAAHGPIPAGMQINHKNGVKHDNRIENLELVTPRENVLHAHETGLAVGKRGHHKLSEEQAVEIKRRLEAGDGPQTALAVEYGVSQGAISHIATGKTWKAVA